jgi:hypothetical protein
MALRSFPDRTGTIWNVWNVQAPTVERSVQEPLRDGWLCFQRADGGDRCRLPLSDAPPVWEELPPERLDLLRRMAELSPPSGSTPQYVSPERESEDAARVRQSGETRIAAAGDAEGE